MMCSTFSRRHNMKQRSLAFTAVVAAAVVTITGCGGGGSGDNVVNDAALYKLSPQKAAKSYLFYGEVDPKGLGALKNVRVIADSAPDNVLVSEDNISAIRYPVISTAFEYNATNGTYSGLHSDKLFYVANGKAYSVPMQNSNGQPQAVQNSSAGNLSSVSYTKVDYLGTQYYLSAKEGNTSVLITPQMKATDAPIVLGNKKVLTVTYPAYGSPADGYLVYDSDVKKIQKCDMTFSACADILDAGSRDFEGDVAGTTYSAVLTGGKLYKVDKNNGTYEEVALGQTIKTGHGTSSFNGGALYFIATDGNLYKTDLLAGKTVKLTKEKDDRLERIRAVTDKWVIVGSDTLLMALKKDGSSEKPIVLVENSKTKGYKYVTLGVGDIFLYELYSLDPKSGDTAYRACIFKDGKTECRANSFWAGISAKTAGKLDTAASYPYEPYAYVRVDDTDSFGGGTLKAIDPAHPMDDGISLGKAPNYNFQTFLTNYRYLTETVDSDGGIVLYAKNDTNYHVDAFYMNLLKENSLVQLTNTDPTGFNKAPRDHCHGRHCMICHNLAGGKIYKDLNGTKSAYGYRVELEFEDGTTLLAAVSKGKGENFSMPIKKITGNFKAKVLDANGTVVNQSTKFYHEGKAYADCNYCHARYGQTREEAPGAITIAQ